MKEYTRVLVIAVNFHRIFSVNTVILNVTHCLFKNKIWVGVNLVFDSNIGHFQYVCVTLFAIPVPRL